MKKLFLMILAFVTSSLIFAKDRSLPPDTTVVSSHSITVKGDRFNYKATTGTQPVWMRMESLLRIATTHTMRGQMLKIALPGR